MNKVEFIEALRCGLAGLPQEDVEERLAFYSEMIDDRIEEGLSEEEAVAAVGSVDKITAQIIADIPLTRIVKEKIKPNRTLKGWEIALIILGFPLWFPLLIAAAAVAFSLYIVVWSLILSLWAVELSIGASALGAILAGIVQFFLGNALPGFAALGAGLFLAGASVFLFFGCIAATKGILKLTKKAAVAVKARFIRKENAA